MNKKDKEKEIKWSIQMTPQSKNVMANFCIDDSIKKQQKNISKNAKKAWKIVRHENIWDQ